MNEVIEIRQSEASIVCFSYLAMCFYLLTLSFFKIPVATSPRRHTTITTRRLGQHAATLAENPEKMSLTRGKYLRSSNTFQEHARSRRSVPVLLSRRQGNRRRTGIRFNKIYSNLPI
jgi:hypothetical protein